MKATNLIALFTVLLMVACDKDDNRAFRNENGRFVRFFLQLNSNNQPLVAPDLDLGIVAVESYMKNNLKPIKIPVTLTSEPLSETVTVSYTAILNNLENVSIEPANELTFSGTQLVDTLTITPNGLWDPAKNPSIELQLTGISDDGIALGMPNDIAPNNRLTINFGTVDLKYNITPPGRVDITGNRGETVLISVAFPNGYIADDIENLDFFTTTQSNFDFTIERQALVRDDRIDFLLTINEDFIDEDLLYKTSLAINAIDGYNQTGVPTINIQRDPITPRDKSVNPAGKFYNVSDPFYRTFGIHWFDSNADGTCTWQDYTVFTNPVVVNADDPNAILADDRGTANTSDDIYHHAFRVSFNANNAGFTTNPFNLKRWFSNEASGSDISPGFNMIPALEFFPDNGNNPTQGVVQIIDQTLQIGTTASNGSVTEFVEINGSGTYKEIAPGLFEIKIDVSLTNNRLFGGTRTDTYRIYNSNNFTEPAGLTVGCKVPIAL